jgi:hypothetical protein
MEIFLSALELMSLSVYEKVRHVTALVCDLRIEIFSYCFCGAHKNIFLSIPDEAKSDDELLYRKVRTSD